MTRAAAALLAAAAATVAACVPGLPGSQLTGDYDAGQAGGAAAAGGGAGGRGGAAPASGGSAATGSGTAGQSGPGSGGAGGAAGIGGPGSGGRATGGTGGPPTSEFAFVTDAGTPPNLAVNASFLFWADTNRRTLTKIRVDGTGGPMSIAPLMTPNTWVAADAQNVYWNGGIPGSPLGILKVGNDGGAPTFLTAATTDLLGIAVNASGVYWATTGGAVMRVGLDGSAPLALVQSGFAAALVVDEQNVYWVGDCGPAAPTGCQTINKVPISGGLPVEITRLQALVSGLAVDPTFIYWADNLGAAVTRSPISGGGPDLALPFAGNATSLAVDPAGIYWTDAKGMVFAALPGAPMQRLVGNSGGSLARGVTLGASNVYWLATAATATGPSLGTIMKAPK